MNKITITLNGKKKEFSEGSSITNLLKSMEVKSKMFVIEKNMKIVDKKDYDSSIINDGDSIEIVGFFGGG